MISTIETVRGRTVESRHAVSAAVVDADGKLVARTGDPGLVTYWRSCAKPFQVLPLLTDGAAGALGVDDAEIAIACASHNGEPRHVAVVEGLLAKAGCTEADLACGAHPSLHPAVARAMSERGEKPRRIHSNCSGKHAAMLALARHHHWPTQDYRQPEHAVQRRVHEEVALWTGVAEEQLGRGTDGCGVVSFALPLRNMALAYARLGAASRDGDPGSGFGGRGPGTPKPNPQPPVPRRDAARRVVRAMASDPFLIAGTGRLCTEVASGSGGRVIAKIGAGGVYCAMIPEAKLGLALKIEDGDDESARLALVTVLDALVPGVVRVPDGFRSPVHRNTLGEVVGGVTARVTLEPGGD